MKNKEIIRKSIQFLLVTVSIFIILEFYQHDNFSFLLKTIITIILIIANCTYNHWCGLRNGIEMENEHNKHIQELREESYNKIIGMVVEEKKADR